MLFCKHRVEYEKKKKRLQLTVLREVVRKLLLDLISPDFITPVNERAQTKSESWHNAMTCDNKSAGNGNCFCLSAKIYINFYLTSLMCTHKTACKQLKTLQYMLLNTPKMKFNLRCPMGAFSAVVLREDRIFVE
jgi:hypothetical protein